MSKFQVQINTTVLQILHIDSVEINKFRKLILEKQYQDVKVLPVPDFWGGIEIIPSKIEFWQGGPGRIHDRLVYRVSEGKWKIDRLAP